MKRKFHVTVLAPDEGVSVSCPELPGCHSQGANVDEALENIEDAIQGYGAVWPTGHSLRNPRDGSGHGPVMPKLPGINHLRAVNALQKAGFAIDRQGKHLYVEGLTQDCVAA